MKGAKETFWVFFSSTRKQEVESGEETTAILSLYQCRRENI